MRCADTPPDPDHRFRRLRTRMLPTRSLTKMVHLALYDASAAMDVSEKYKSWSVRASRAPPSSPRRRRARVKRKALWPTPLRTMSVLRIMYASTELATLHSLLWCSLRTTVRCYVIYAECHDKSQ